MNNLLRRIVRWCVGADYLMQEWQREHDEKLADLKNTLEHRALRMLGYEVVCNLRAKYYVEGQLPDCAPESLYTLQTLKTTMSNSTQNDEIGKMEKAINEGFAESERDLKDKKTPLDQPTQNDWEKRYEEFITFVTNEKNWIDGRPVWKEYKYVTLANAIKYFIRKELADARREVYLEIEEKVMECKKDITKYQNTTDILNKTITKHERAWINSGFRLALESLDKLQKFVVLATLRKEEKHG